MERSEFRAALYFSSHPSWGPDTGREKTRRRRMATPGGFKHSRSHRLAATSATAPLHPHDRPVVVMTMMTDRDHPAAPDGVAMVIVVGDVTLDVGRPAAGAVEADVGPRRAAGVTCFRSGGGQQGSDSESEDSDQFFHDVVLGFTRSDEAFRRLFKNSGIIFHGRFQTTGPFPMARERHE